MKLGFQKAAQFLANTDPAKLIPPAIHIPRMLEIDLDSPDHELFRRPVNLP